jgi:hypothetical protein
MNLQCKIGFQIGDVYLIKGTNLRGNNKGPQVAAKWDFEKPAQRSFWGRNMIHARVYAKEG